jgi:pyruvate/2-oxoglutarate/acetoin dehydrogenase E1 component
MSTLEFRDAVRDALAEEIERDPSVIFFGEDIAAAGGVFAVTPGLIERFGRDRVFDTPISELALAGAAYGAAVTGLRPVARTNKLLAVEEGPRTGGWASGLLGAVAEYGLHDLDDAWIVATDETPIPYSPSLEDAYIPDADAIIASVRGRAGVAVA